MGLFDAYVLPQEKATASSVLGKEKNILNVNHGVDVRIILKV